MNAPSDWQEAAGLVTVIGAVGGLALRAVLGRTRAGLTPMAHHVALAARVENIERLLAGLPSAVEMKTLTDRVGSVETGVAVAQATLRGVSDGIGRVERMLDLLVQNELKKEAAA